MAEERVQRKLAAILAADAAGYSRLTQTVKALVQDTPAELLEDKGRGDPAPPVTAPGSRRAARVANVRRLRLCT